MASAHHELQALSYKASAAQFHQFSALTSHSTVSPGTNRTVAAGGWFGGEEGTTWLGRCSQPVQHPHRCWGSLSTSAC